jgi:hypothetical protein
MSTTLERMQQMATQWRQAGDRRAIFAEAYGTMTANMEQAVGGSAFTDPVWVARLLERFADYYFGAVHSYEHGSGGCPQVWAEAFRYCDERDLHPLQHLFLGVNAHINYDLPLALVDVLDDWPLLAPDRRDARYRDYEAVNRVIGGTIDAVQADVVAERSPMLGWADAVLGRVDEWLFSHLIGDWRDDVWDRAVRLLESDETTRPALLVAIDDRAQRIARLVAAI